MPLISLENLQRFKEKLDDKIGTAGGLAQLDENGHVVLSQFPDSVFNVQEFQDASSFPEQGNTNVLYVDQESNNIYRWNGEEYTNISSPDGVKYIEQILTEEQKLQARNNIGAASSEDTANTVKYSLQELSTEEKQQARANIEAVSTSEITGVVRFDEDQTALNAAYPITSAQQIQARANIGAISAAEVNSQITGVVKYTKADGQQDQGLTTEEKTQARKNIGAVSSDEVSSAINTATAGAVRFDEDQTAQSAAHPITSQQKQTARTNIGAISAEEVSNAVTGVVKYTEQTLGASQKEQARTNIGAISSEEVNNYVAGVVKYTAEAGAEDQGLTGEQKAQARKNIGAASSSDLSNLSSNVTSISNSINQLGEYVDIVEAIDSGVKIHYNTLGGATREDDVLIDTTKIPFDSGYVAKVGSGQDEKYMLHLTMGGTDVPSNIFTPFEIPAGGGGSGGVTSYILVTNVTAPSSVRNGKPAVISFTAADGADATNRIETEWLVNGQSVLTQSDQSGTTFSFDAKNYLLPSRRNVVRVNLSSSGGAKTYKEFTITTIAFSIEWSSSIEPIMLYSTNSDVYVQIAVSAESTINTVTTVQVGTNSAHSVERTNTGNGTLTVKLDKSWFVTGVNTVTAKMYNSANSEDKADDIHFIAIWSTGATQPIVAFANESQEGTQYDKIEISYYVYDPDNEQANCTLQFGSEAPRAQVASRAIQKYPYISSEVKNITVTLTCSSSSDTMELNIVKSKHSLGYVVDDSLLYNLDPSGHTNLDTDREDFADLTFNGLEYKDNPEDEEEEVKYKPFDWINGGFKQDEYGTTALVIKKGNRVELPRSVFADSDGNGKTIDISFKITNSDNYNAVAVQDVNSNGTKGVILRANEGEIKIGSASGQIFRYCEESRIDLSFLVEKSRSQRVATIWLDGIPSKVVMYADNSLTQSDQNMIIAPKECDVWIYGIRCYNAELTKQQMIQNYVSEGNTLDEKVKRFEENNIYDRGVFTPEQLKTAMPQLTIITIAMPRMTTSKEDPVPAEVRIMDGSETLELEAATGPKTKDGTIVKVQGTSSAAYGRSSYNMDIDFKPTGKKYKISSNSIGVNYLNIKVNVASSENANNVCAVDWYNEHQPYRTETRSVPGCRDVIEAKPCAVFITNTADNDVWFSSVKIPSHQTMFYAMGDLCNSKKNKAVFGQEGEQVYDEDNEEYLVEHPTKACIEVSGNDTDPERFISTAATFMPDSDDGDGRWETEEWSEREQKYVTVKHFEWRMVPSAEDKDEIVASWNALVAWVVSTNGDPQKFKNEVGNYFAIDSLLYHFLFIEFFAAYDNVSKNTFYSYDWDPSSEKYLWNICKAYDMDTIFACDNDGKPYGDYGLDFRDIVEGKEAFNAYQNPIWNNIKAAFYNELSAMYIALRSEGTWDSNLIANKWDNYQARRPHAAMVEDAYNKYILPYQTVIDSKTGPDVDYLPRLNGSKTYQRKQYLTYQSSYMDGKYGYYNKSSSLQFRTNGESKLQNFAITSYARTYITFIKDGTTLGSQKVNAGGTTVFEGVTVGNDTTMYVTPDKLVQKIEPLNNTQNRTFKAAGAAKLEEVILGGDIVNSTWDDDTVIYIPSVLLKNLSIRNIINYPHNMDLSQNVELETLDTRNTNTGRIVLPSFAPLKTIQLNNCTELEAYNLNNVNTFTMDSGANLYRIIIENCNDVFNSSFVPYLTQAINTQAAGSRHLRAININWTFDTSSEICALATKWKGLDALGAEQNASVVTGTVTVTTLSSVDLEQINSVWSKDPLESNLDRDKKTWTANGLTIKYTTLETYYKVEFVNPDGTIIKTPQGREYVQVVKRGGYIEDPYTNGYVQRPSMSPDAENTYIWTEAWDNIDGQVMVDRTVANNNPVVAVYRSIPRVYTVRWFRDIDEHEELGSKEVNYGGSAVFYDPANPSSKYDYPTDTSLENTLDYKLFKGWDKSTGFIRGDTNVHALWDEGSLPNPGEKTMNEMSVAQIYGVAKRDSASTYWTADGGDYKDIQIGKDFNFLNVASQELVSERYFNGSEILKTDIKLFDENADNFTIAIDYEFAEAVSGATIAACYDPAGSEGFRLYYYAAGTNGDKSIRVQWGDKTDNIVGYDMAHGIVVLRHIKGSNNLFIYSNNAGQYTNHAEGSGGETTTHVEYDRYYPDMAGQNGNGIESVRVQSSRTDAVLSFGAIPEGTDGRRNPAKGWIHWCKIWYDDIGVENAIELANWTHETWRMIYRGSGIYTKADGTGKTDSASFVAACPLPLYFDMYEKNASNTAGGWSSSPLRTFVNKRCFDALPYEWQSIIKTVALTTKGGSDKPTVTQTTNDKIYIPAYGDMTAVADSPYNDEGTLIPWFVDTRDSSGNILIPANATRLMFNGIVVPSDATYYTTFTDDPALYSSTVLKEGDIWIKNNDKTKCYIFVPKEVSSKHGYYGGRKTADTGNNVITTAQVNGALTEIGVWVKSVPYWTRSPGTADYYQGIVQASGAPTLSGYVGYEDNRARGVLLAFSI